MARPKQTGEKLEARLNKAQTIIEYIQEGNSVSASCDKHNVAISTFMGWIDSNSKLAEKYARAKDCFYQILAVKLWDMVNEEPQLNHKGNIDNAWVTNHNNKVNHLKWLLSKLLPREYSDKLLVENSGTINHNIPIIKVELVGVDKDTDAD